MDDKPRNIQQNSPAQSQAPNDRMQADSQLVNDSKANAASENLQQGSAGRELNPEFGDAADPASEKQGIGGRDDASPLNTSTT